ncbi:hypothetical protein [Streptomyces cahuitamycinicus]|uniref:hypothetical protein n=1 Tax=Streptomyces cahuitamycinicus TaxID=2070367 RepID=UPI001FE70CC3|nr:hypothetical protein [Streptomyces cahuitamycinicus]
MVLRVAVVEGPGGIGEQDPATGGTSPAESAATGRDTVGQDGKSARETTSARDGTSNHDCRGSRDRMDGQDGQDGTDAAPRPRPPADPRETATADASAACGAASTDATDATDATATSDADSARPPFSSVTIRTALDAVTATALYLRRLGYRGVRRADQRPPSGIGLAARGVVAQVDPAVRPAGLRDVECLWLTAMTESADCLYFSLAGYADDARARADALGVPLFVLDLTGTPRPVNTPAETLAATGTEQRTP